MILKLAGTVAERIRTSSVARGAATTLGARIYGAVAAYLTQIFVARSIGAEQLGIYAFAWTWLTLLGFLSPLGFDTSLVRLIASYQSCLDWAKLRGALSLGHRTTLVASSIAAGTGIAVVFAIDAELSHEYSKPLIFALLALPAMALANLYEGIARGFRWIPQVAIPSFAVRPTIFLLLAIVSIEFFPPASGGSIVLAAVFACGLTLALQHAAYRRRLPEALRSVTPRSESRAWLRTSMPMMLVVSFEMMLANTDILMVGLIRSPAETGVYNIAVRTSACLLFIFFAVSAFAAPRIAELFARGDQLALIRFSQRVRFWVLGPTLAGALLLVAVGPLLLSLFGEEFQAAYLPMLVLTLGVLGRAAVGPVDQLLTMTGKERQIAGALAIAAALNVAANALLIPRFGSIGAACATACSVLLELVIISVLAGRHIGFRPFLLQPVSTQ